MCENSELLKAAQSFRFATVHDGHPLNHPGECACVPATRDVPTHALAAGATRRGCVCRTSRQRAAIRRLGAPRAREGCIAVRLEGSPVRPGMGPTGRRVRRPQSRCRPVHAWPVPTQSRFAIRCESRRRKGEARVPRSTSSAGTRPLRSRSWGEFPRVENRINDRGGEDRVGWSQDILATCRASDRGAGIRSP